MRKALIFAAFAAFATSATASHATTWVATCNDGENIQYVQTVNGAGYLYLKTAKDYFQTARLAQTSADDTIVCGAVQGNVAAGLSPLTQLCINKSRHAITLKYSKPGTPAGAVQDAGVFCAATITLRATNLKDN